MDKNYLANWFVHDNYSVGCGHIANGVNYGNSPICRITLPTSVDDGSVARLIAAAPDLLAALELVANTSDLQWATETGVHEVVRSAIAKAKGE